MLVVRNVFTAKPGQASKLAAQFKAAIAAAEIPRSRVLTDVTGEFNRVIMEYEVDGIAEFDAQMKNYATNTKMRDAMAGYTDLFIGGYREVLQTA